MRNFFLCAGLALVLAGCAPFNLVEPAPKQIGSAYKVTPGVAWNAYSKSHFGLVSERWTIDGMGLDAIGFWHDIKDGESLLTSRTQEYPKFEADMRPTEIVELVSGSLARVGAQDFESRNLRPAKFGSAEGFRFEMTYILQSGLRMRGTILGAVVDEKLQLISYVAPELHYYEKHLEEAEKIMASVQLL